MFRIVLILVIIVVLVGSLYYTLEKRRQYPPLPNLQQNEVTEDNFQTLDSDLTAIDRDILELEQINVSLQDEVKDL